MKNLNILLKNNINCFLGSIQGKRARKRTYLIVSLCILFYIGICTIYGFQVLALFKTMGELGLGEIPLFNSYQIVLMLLILFAFQSLNGKAKTQDSDLLLSMPIKKIDIVISKTISKYLFLLLIISMIILPTTILYCIFVEISANIIFWNLFLLVFLPLFSIGISYCVDFVVSKLFNKLKHANVIKAVLVILLFGAFFAVYMYNSSIMGFQTSDTIEKFLSSNFIVGWCVKLIVDNNLLCLLYISLLVLFLFILGMIAYSYIYGKSYLSYNIKSDTLKFSKGGLFDGMLNKELKKYFDTPIYMINTIIGPMLLVILTIFLCVKNDMDFSVIFGQENVTQNFFSVVILVYLFMASMTMSSACSISLEGKSLWILRSTPSNTKKILLAKSLVNMILFIPVHLITAIIILLVFHGGQFEWIMFILLPLILNIVISFMGTYINLLLPKLKWDSEVQVVKNSASILVTMLFGIIIAMFPIILNLFGVNIYMCGWITLAFYLILAIISVLLLFIDGKNRFNKLDC